MAGKLTAARVRALIAEGIKKAHPDGNNLYLTVTGPGVGNWPFRYKIAGKTTWLGLGPVDLVTLAEAREKATACRKMLLDGLDPLKERRKAQAAARAAREANTFQEAAEAYIAENRASWSNAKHRYQWDQSLAAYVYPLIGTVPVAEIETNHVLKVLRPIWTTKSETAVRVRGRIEKILDFARVQGWRTAEANPARWSGHLDHVLPARSKIVKVAHHAAIDWRAIGAFMAELEEKTDLSAMVLRFIILTASRSGEAIGATWSEIDMAEKVWTIPASRMKAGQEHRVPLSDAAMAILDNVKPLRDAKCGELIFPSTRPLKPLSNMVASMLLRRMGYEDITVHGFRSAFKDWANEATAFANEVSEAALAHTIKSKTERAYRRGDALEKRRLLMEAWARHCATQPAAAGDVVVHMNTARA